MTKISEIQLEGLNNGEIIHSRRYKLILSTVEKRYLSMILTALFRYWNENGRKPIEIYRSSLEEYINEHMPSYNTLTQTRWKKTRACSHNGLRNTMQTLCPVFIRIYTKFNSSNGNYTRIYRSTPLLCEWFRRKA